LDSRITVLVGILAIGVVLAMDTVARNLFDLLQGVIAFVAPPMGAVFLIGVLFRQATATAAFSTLVFGSIVSLGCGVCHFKEWPNAEFWPHYLLLSFYLFASICAFMILVSLLTQHSSEEQPLATLRQTYAKQHSTARLVWVLWGVLAVIMLSIYILFD
jgi:SSS family solute:Na+ symporter